MAHRGPLLNASSNQLQISILAGQTSHGFQSFVSSGSHSAHSFLVAFYPTLWSFYPMYSYPSIQQKLMGIPMEISGIPFLHNSLLSELWPAISSHLRYPELCLWLFSEARLLGSVWFPLLYSMVGNMPPGRKLW